MKALRLEAAVFLVAAFLLSLNLPQTGIASGIQFSAHDEATYTREAIEMSLGSGWMTPSLLGRWIFEKPPLLIWLSASSMKLFGISPFTARIPAVLAGALLCMLCFTLTRPRSLTAGFSAAAIAFSSQILFTMARHNMTDILFAASSLCALAVLIRDPALRRPTSLILFAAATAAGILTDIVPGLLTLPALFVVTALTQRSWIRALLALALTAILAAPWFTYNLLEHHAWFLADIILPAFHTPAVDDIWLCILRLVFSDFLLLFLILYSLPALSSDLRRVDPKAILVTTYALSYTAAILLSAPLQVNLACLIPPLILLAGWYSPWMQGKGAAAIIVAAGLLFTLKVTNPSEPYGIDIRPGSTLSAAPALGTYCKEHRATTLYVFGVNDEMLSAALPLHHVRYGWVDPSGATMRDHAYLAKLGIFVRAADFPATPPSTKAFATGIPARNPAELRQIILQHPESDYLVSRTLVPNPATITTHHITAQTADFTLLESNLPTPTTPTTPWPCQM